jgi:DNA-binding beta-propeller fold protein YncE
MAASTIATAALPKLVATIPLPDVGGRIDHMALDPKRQRLYIAALGNNSVEIVDLGRMSWIGRIPGLDEPQGVAYVPGVDRIAVTNGGDGTCILYGADSLNLLKVSPLGEDCDNVRYDAAHRRLVVGYGSGGLAVVDPRSGSLVENVKLPAHPESFQLDRTGRWAVVNVPDVQKIFEVDLERRVVSGRWPVPAQANFAMAVDSTLANVFVATRKQPTLFSFDRHASTFRSQAPIGRDADDVFLDARRQRLYVSCGEGELDVIGVSSTGVLTPSGRVPTAPGARTCLFIPERGEVAVAAPRRGSEPARILLFDVSK